MEQTAGYHTPRPQQHSNYDPAQPQSKNQVLISHGRAPWYGPDGRNVEAYVVGIAGGSASGKTSVARAILSALNYIPTVLILSQDSFYNAHSPEEVELAFKNDLDLDHPDAIDMTLFAQCIKDLKQGKATEIPVYSFHHHQRMPEKKYIYGASVIIVEGIMALQSAELRELYDLKVFVNCDSDLMLARRIKRDVKERGRDVEGILDQASDSSIYSPSSRYADIIVPGSSNQLAIELLVSHIKRQLDSRSLRFRRVLADIGQNRNSSTPSVEKFDKQIVLLEQSNQLRGIMTILRDRTTHREEFIFHIDRLSTVIVEKALTLIPCEPRIVRTPNKNVYKGASQTKNLVGVSILRSGLPFSQGLRRVIRDVPIGGILIQSDPKTGEPLLLKSDLPHCMGTGAAAMMAIRVLLDHGISQDRIIFLTYLISRSASYSVLHAFPDIQIVTAAIDPGLDEVKIPYMPGSLMLGEAAGEGDFAVRLVDQFGHEEKKKGDDVKDLLKTDEELAADGFKMNVLKGIEELKFSRKHKRANSSTGEKRAWVISPGEYAIVTVVEGLAHQQ
ncbi:uridine kinase [Cryptococcus gattii VGV]|nr:uridine kinase [Cryptococcus gattii VGV]